MGMGGPAGGKRAMPWLLSALGTAPLQAGGRKSQRYATLRAEHDDRAGICVTGGRLIDHPALPQCE